MPSAGITNRSRGGMSAKRASRRATAIVVSMKVAAVTLPALPALAFVSSICALVVAYEAVVPRDSRLQLRHPERQRVT